MNVAPTFHKTRIAPTPSGFLHLGNVLSFAVTAALAWKTQAGLLLRIDDLDRDRVQREYVQDIFDTLHFLDIPWEEGPADYTTYETVYSQLHRMDLYREALRQLEEAGQVFACTCSRAQVAAMSPDGAYPGTCRHKNIPLDTPGVSWRLHTSATKELNVKTLPGEVVRATLPLLMQEFVVRKKDGDPAYQLTSVLDDQYFGVDLVVRGADLWGSTLAQLYLSTLLPGNTFQQCTFFHHPLLLETADQKLSKSAGATSVQFLRREGKQPADIYAMIAGMLGIDTGVYDFHSLATALDGLPGWEGL
ncbi:tRNA glutamyl-Q(34) synthetase GluQRS [Chitinophaga japonensis]